MKRILLILALAIMVFAVGRWLYVALASDETKIRWLVEDMDEAYDEAEAGDCIAPLAREWSHANHAIDREMIRGAVFRDWMEDRDPRTKELLRRVDLDYDTLLIEVEDERASFQVVAVFQRQKDGEWGETWRIRAEAELEKDEGGWRIVRTSHEDLQGTQLSR